jgi:ribosomal protein S18 acetylase RimI-like enzyme
MPKIEYSVTDRNDIDLIGPLWEKLNQHHRVRSPHHAAHFARMTFDLRKKVLLEKTGKGTMHIDLAKDTDTGTIVGYCLSTVSKEKEGEIQSIFIEKDYRLHGIGDNFMKKAIEWMDGLAVTKRTIAVAAGNEEVFAFYSRYNFYPRFTILQNTTLYSDR